MAVSDEVDVVLNQTNKHSQRKQQNQTGQGQVKEKKRNGQTRKYTS